MELFVIENNFYWLDLLENVSTELIVLFNICSKLALKMLNQGGNIIHPQI